MILEFQISDKSDNYWHVHTQLQFFSRFLCKKSQLELEIFRSAVQISQD